MKPIIKRKRRSQPEPGVPEDTFMLLSRALLVLYALFIIMLAVRFYTPYLLP